MEDDVIDGLPDEPGGTASATFRALLAARERATEAFRRHKEMLLGSARSPAARTSPNP